MSRSWPLVTLPMTALACSLFAPAATASPVSPRGLTPSPASITPPLSPSPPGAGSVTPSLARSPAVTPSATDFRPEATMTLVGPPAATRTPAPSADCPPGGGRPPPITYPDSARVFDFEPQILAHLDAGGETSALHDALARLTMPGVTPPVHLRPTVAEEDVSGDLVPDVIVALTLPRGAGFEGTALWVFTCRLQRYEGMVLRGLTHDLGEAAAGLELFALEDMNGDGVAEIVFTLAFGAHRAYHIAAWDGAQFASLIAPDPISGEYATPYYAGEGAIADVDGNGTLELVLPTPAGLVDIWAWNGIEFALAREGVRPPERP